MRVHVVDPPAYTPPYDHALCSALARQGAEVELITSRFGYGKVPPPVGYLLRESFYRRALGPPGSRVRSATRLLTHVPDMLRYRRQARTADVVHFQWLPVQWVDPDLLPNGPVVLTAHDLLPREPRPGQARAQRRLYDAVRAIVVHSAYGRSQLVEQLGIDSEKVHVIHHGVFEHLAAGSPGGTTVSAPSGMGEALPEELARVQRPVVLFFGLLRPYKGIDVLLEAWRGISDAELWIVGRPRIALESLRAGAPPGVRFVPRFVSDAELPAFFRRADLVVLPYARTERLDFSGVLATALAFEKPVVVSDVGGFSEVAALGAARLVPPADPEALRDALRSLLEDSGARAELAAGAKAAAEGAYSWDEAARATLALYERLVG